MPEAVQPAWAVAVPDRTWPFGATATAGLRPWPALVVEGHSGLDVLRLQDDRAYADPQGDVDDEFGLQRAGDQATAHADFHGRWIRWLAV